MPIPVFDTCCGCIELKSACFIIGYLQLVSEIPITLVVLIFLAVGEEASTSDDEQTQETGAALLAFGVILALIMAVLLGFTITLLIGLHKNKRNYVKAYLIYSAIFMVVGVILFFASFFQNLSAGNYFSDIFGLMLHCYFVLVIRSYYFKMDDVDKGAVYNAA